METQHDQYLDEIQYHLKENIFKNVSLPTLWRALSTLGITNKTVQYLLLANCPAEV